jgi:putative ATP-binding cassette transporter
MLSLGEQQRLMFARLLLLQPRFAVLDEATSSLDAATARHLYALLAASPITYVSIAGDSALRPYHDAALDLKGDGRWSAADTPQLAKVA